MAFPAPAAAGAAGLWEQHDRERLSWAFRAYDRFIAALSPDIRRRLAHKDGQAESYVVVFGKTQVGKTTLLLELMGVLPTELMRVSRVLRGRQAMGQSATATTMEYRRSPDRRWGLRVGEGATTWFAADAEIESALAALRGQMEAGRLDAPAPSSVLIPADCFASDAGEPAVRMLDLPGDKPANATEQKHVIAMAEKYVRLADLILLVGKGDDLSFLQEGALTLPGIEDWQSAPRRFKIVTTYSFTPQSVREHVRQTGATADAGPYRQRLIEQIEKSIPLSEEARQADNFFPLEFGQSWLDAEQQQPLIYRRVAPVVDALKRQLLAEIHASTTPVARLRAAVDAHIVITRVKEKRLAAMDAQLAALRGEERQARSDLSGAQSGARAAAKACQGLQQQLQVLAPARLQQDLDEHFRLPDRPEFGSPNEKVSGFKICIGAARSFFVQAVAGSRPAGAALGESAPFWRSLDIIVEKRRIDAILDDVYHDLNVTLDKYVLDTYWSTSTDSNYARDKATLEYCNAEAHRRLTALARRWWLEAALQGAAACAAQLANDQAGERSWRQAVEDGGRAVAALESSLERHAQARRAFSERVDADLHESRRFVDLLDEEYLAELQERRRIVAADQRPVRALAGLMAAVELAQVRQQVLLHVDEPQAFINSHDGGRMTVRQEIARQEQEFKELLGRVMRDPLAPVHNAVTNLDARLEELEAMLQGMRDVELSALGLNLEEVGTQVRRMKSKVDETPREVRHAVEPVLQRLQSEVEGTRLATQAVIKEEGERAGEAAQHLGAQLAAVAATVSESRDTLQGTLQGKAEQMEGVLRSLTVDAHEQVRHLANDLGGKVARQAESNQQDFGRLRAALDGAIARMCEQSAGERAQAEQRILALASSLADMRELFERQSEQLAALRQQQEAIPARLDEQLRELARRLARPLLIGAGAVCLGCAGTVLLVMQRF